MAIQSRIVKFSNVNMNLKLNSPGSVSMTVDATDASNFFIQPVIYCLLVYRNGALVWSGPVWTTDETHTFNSRKISFTAVGWAELLNHRVLRTLPGYGISTSSLTFTNGTFESAISGWTGTNGSLARDTVVFRSGAGSLRLSENLATPGPSHTLVSGRANALSGTPTSGKKYRMNFYARARKDARLMNALPPFLEILEGAVRVAYLDLSNLFNGGSRLSSSGAFTFNSTFENSWTTTGAFAFNSIDWVSSGVATTFNFGWYASTPLMAGYVPGTGFTSGDSSTSGSWLAAINVVGFDTMHCDGVHWLYARTPQPSGVIDVGIADWGGEFDTTKTYTCNVSFSGLGYTEGGSGEFAIYNGGSGGYSSRLGGTGAGTFTGGSSSLSFTFTPSGTQPLWFRLTGTWAAPAGSDVLRIMDISFYENGTDTDPLLNIDDVTMQEFIGDGIYQNLDAGQVAINLLNKANADGATKIAAGSVETTQLRTRTYQRFSNIGKEIAALSSIESGFDYVVDPITRALNIYNRTNATNFPASASSGNAGAGSWLYSADRTSVLKFDWGSGKSNLNSWRRTKDASSIVNRLNVQGKYALGVAEDTSAESTYGIFEDIASLPDVIDATNTVLPAYANAEIAIRKTPKTLYEVGLNVGGPNAPQLFIDFNVGDKAVIDVTGQDSIQNITSPMTVRIFGVSLTIDQEGNETVSGIQLSQ